MTNQLPSCAKRKLVDGIQMCYAIGCCEVGDMPCECELCLQAHGGMCKLDKDKRNGKSNKEKRG